MTIVSSEAVIHPVQLDADAEQAHRPGQLEAVQHRERGPLDLGGVRRRGRQLGDLGSGEERREPHLHRDPCDEPSGARLLGGESGSHLRHLLVDGVRAPTNASSQPHTSTTTGKLRNVAITRADAAS